MRKWLSLLTITSFLSSCVSIPTGDGGKLKISKGGIEVEDKEGEKLAFSLDKDKESYNLDFGDGNSTQIGTNIEIPEDFPKDIFLPSNGQLIQSTKTEEGGLPTYVLTFLVEGNHTENRKLYDDFLKDNGYEVQEQSIGDMSIALHGKKLTRYLHYQLLGSDEEATYTVSVSYGHSQEDE